MARLLAEISASRRVHLRAAGDHLETRSGCACRSPALSLSKGPMSPSSVGRGLFWPGEHWPHGPQAVTCRFTQLHATSPAAINANDATASANAECMTSGASTPATSALALLPMLECIDEAMPRRSGA